MSLFGSLFTGVSGIGAQSQSTAMIANNIANVNTVGFKRSEASFFSLVTSEGRSSRYSPGTVSVNRIQRVNQQGPIAQSVSGTDVSISGNGFFAVKRESDPSQQAEFLYTRNGQFSEDAQGLLRNSAGFYLYGWPLDAEGNLPAAQGDLSSLTAVDVAFLGGLTRPTSTAELSINLDSTQERTTYTDDAVLGLSADGPAHFSRGLRVFDSLGSSQDMQLEFHHILAPTAISVSNAAPQLDLDTDLGVAMPGITEGEAFTMTVGGTSEIFEYDTNGVLVNAGATGFQTLGELINAINATFAFPDAAEAHLTDSSELAIEVVDVANTLTLTNVGAGNILAAANLNMSATGVISSPTYPPGNTTSAGAEGNIFPDLEDASTANTQGWWQVVIRHPDGTEITRGVVNFSGDGTLNAASDVNGDTDIQLNDVNWNNGSSLQDISIDISRFSQFAGNFDVIFSDQNGAELGLRTGVEIDREGFVVARFSNGATAQLYKLPLVTFSNPNGLTEVSGTAYSESEESGEENLREAGAGGSGFLESATLENSNVDLADEFAKLIIGQRAFAANTRVINTVDQMTEDLLRLR